MKLAEDLDARYGDTIQTLLMLLSIKFSSISPDLQGILNSAQAFSSELIIRTLVEAGVPFEEDH
ncbi:hypothetical protein [Frigidibacter oleivorans]|uniref:hypothetical protein n=1 Tax=Frigidibacter oleivorans TaxID=2487129 RepID=UPI000F8EF1CC|nr:hypothetical protein [Frigidibacter oleivorans]